MKITLLVLHIVSAILFGACAVISTNLVSEILWMVASVLNGVLVGLDIADLIWRSID